jgi:TonB family protein
LGTSPNPEHLLRRPKKRTGHPQSGAKFVIAAVGSVVAIAAVAGYMMFNHQHSAAANASLVGAPAAQVSTLLPAPHQFSLSGLLHPGKHVAAKTSPTAKPSPQASPSPTATPQTTATTAPAAKTAAQIAKARHAAALRLAALRREAAQTQSADSALNSPIAENATPQPVLQTSPPTQAPATAAPATVAPDAQPTPVYAPLEVVDARFIEKVAPVYPEIAKEQGAQGTAIVLATVGPAGNVISVSMDQSTGNHLLDQAALTAARSSKFEPPQIDGKPATETYRILYTFDPNQ